MRRPQGKNSREFDSADGSLQCQGMAAELFTGMSRGGQRTRYLIIITLFDTRSDIERQNVFVRDTNSQLPWIGMVNATDKTTQT